MEAFFMTRGKSDEVDHLIKWLSTRGLPMPIKNADGTMTQVVIETQMRPIQLWGYVFPRENEDLVVNSLGLFANHKNDFPTQKYNINPKLWALRKLLAAKEFKEPKNKADKMFMPYERWKNVNILGVGIKDDADIAESTHERI